MTYYSIFLSCVLLSFFAARASTRRSMAALQKSDLTLQIACWAISKLLICIVVSGFVAATFIQGPRLVPIWIVSVLATLIGHFEGMKKAANNKSDKDGK